MALLNRDDWYDIARDVDWTLSYVDTEAAFPEEWVGAKGIPSEDWVDWDEPFRVSFREYVMVQREKEAGVGAIREAMVRAKLYRNLDEGHRASTHLHMQWHSLKKKGHSLKGIQLIVQETQVLSVKQ
jgi:hypothetical protein